MTKEELKEYVEMYTEARALLRRAESLENTAKLRAHAGDRGYEVAVAPEEMMLLADMLKNKAQNALAVAEAMLGVVAE